MAHEITKERVFTPMPNRYHKRQQSARSRGQQRLRKSELSNSNPDLMDIDDDAQSVVIENFDEMQSAFLQMNLARVEEILNELNQNFMD